MSKHDRDHKPRLIAFEVTRRCRFNCRHCRADADRLGGPDELTTDQCKRIIKAVADYEKCVIILTGGEPTERDDFLDLVRYSRQVGLRVVTATCGYAINDETLAEMREAGILALSFSLDGATAKTHDAFRRVPGAFDIAVNAARTAARAGMQFQINTTITRTNLAEVPAIAELAKDLGAYCFNPFILVPTGRGEQIADEILEPAQYGKLLSELLDLKDRISIEVRVTCGPSFARLYRQRHKESPRIHISGCMGGRGFGFISHTGDVQTCGFLDISAGNLVENGYDFAAIWDRSKFLNEIRDVSSYNGKCGLCDYANLCGGCRARAYTMTGDYLGEDPVCWYGPRRTS